jgi:hypothetical protein
MQFPTLGHEVNQKGPRPAVYARAFEARRAVQRGEMDSILKNPEAKNVMRGVKAYINGYLVSVSRRR